MPLFTNKFSPKKIPGRKTDPNLSRAVDPSDSQEFGTDIGPIKLRLGDQEAVFDNGQWIPETGPVSGKHKENEKLRQAIKRLEDENSMLKLRAEILLDMLTQTTAESHLQLKEINKLKSSGSKTSNFKR
ncbi:protein chibby homolog 1-like [Frankliniella occidentalis]|uniref:Protein chibby homolog 1-like n=1 Tax=Frankliniella occidentalis TaxID=133901 RepID=A0A6J1SGB1_FRAOC|nr:protein chibby homolog 1-like [Frankliniella occidentalis]XP_052127910.1 protein chibby homolog 1-like [Frankliniella occidentalis]